MWATIPGPEVMKQDSRSGKSENTQSDPAEAKMGAVDRVRTGRGPEGVMDTCAPRRPAPGPQPPWRNLRLTPVRGRGWWGRHRGGTAEVCCSELGRQPQGGGSRCGKRRTQGRDIAEMGGVS